LYTNCHNSEFEKTYGVSKSLVLILDTEFNVLFVNKAASEAAGKAEHEIAGNKCFNIFHESDATPAGCPLKKMLDSKTLESQEMYIESLGRTWLVTCIPVFDLNGDIRYAVHAMTDVTDRKLAEAALRENENRFRMMFENMSDCVAVYDAVDGGSDFVFRDFNKRAEETDKISRNELIGQKVSETFPGIKDMGLFSVLGRVWQTGVPESFVDKRYEDKRIFGWRNNYVYKLPSGEIVAIYKDITRRIQTEEALIASEIRFRRLFDSMTDAFVGTNMEGRINEFNKAFINMLGYEPEEITELKYFELTPEKWHEYETEVINAQILPRGFSDVYIKEYRKKDGTIFPVELRTFLIRDDKGEPDGMWAIVRDITERAKAEEAIRQSENKFHSLYDNLMEGVALHELITDAGGAPVDYRIIDVNPSFESILKIAKDAVLGKKATEAYGVSEAPYLSDYASVALNRSTYSFETYFPQLDKHFAISAIPWGEMGFATIFSDITERKRAEAEQLKLQEQLIQSQKMESIGTLAGGIAHDFNNMLAIIVGNAQLLQSEISPEMPGAEEIGDIVSAVQRAKELTMQLLTFARKEKVNVKSADVNKLIGDISSVLSRSIHKKIEIQTTLGCKSRVSIDFNQMFQALLNICANACDAMPAGGKLAIESSEVEIGGEYAEVLKEGKYCLIKITDTGIGMAEDMRQRIFEPFFTTKGIGKGTGLGLAITHGIVKNHEGHIEVESEPGIGTSFSVYIPLSDFIEEDAAEEEIAEHKRGSETILIIDDEKAILKFSEKALENAGYKVYATDNPREGLEIYKKRADKIALALLDMMMPDMDGEDVYRELIKINPKVKVIISSGYSPDGRIGALMADGIQGFLQKPFKNKDLCKTIRNVLDS